MQQLLNPHLTCCAVGSKPIWTPRSARGKHFPWCKVPVEVWGIGAFKFKGIAGQSKVSLPILPTVNVLCLLLCPDRDATHSKHRLQHDGFGWNVVPLAFGSKSHDSIKLPSTVLLRLLPDVTLSIVWQGYTYTGYELDMLPDSSLSWLLESTLSCL